jgi:hypothetical protein
MSTKMFKLGEWGIHPRVKLTTGKDRLRVQKFDWDNEQVEVVHYSYESIHNFELDMCEETSSYYASTMVEWVHATKEYKASYKEPDPFTTFTFSTRRFA